MFETEALKKLRPNCKYAAIEYQDGRFELHWEDETCDPPTDEEIAAAAQEYADGIPMQTLRRNRDKLLSETDWWASSDRTMTAEQTAYRQALRDLPANTDDPANPTWPTKP